MRDLQSDLSLCLKAPAGLWSRVKAIGARYWTIGVIKDHVARPFEGDEAEAAPDLLEAAKAAVARMTADCLGLCGSRPGSEICREIACPVLADIQRLEAAVAKAEGRDEK